MHNNLKKILRSRFLVNLEKQQFALNKKKGSPGLFSRQSLREFRYSHARRHAFKTPDFIRSALAHELFGLPLTASCACAGERAPEQAFCFVLFALKTSFTVKVNFVGLLCRVFTRTLGRFALFLSNSIERKFEMK